MRVIPLFYDAPDDDDDDANDLPCAAVDGQHVDEIQHQNDDDEGDQNADERRHGAKPQPR